MITAIVLAFLVLALVFFVVLDHKISQEITKNQKRLDEVTRTYIQQSKGFKRAARLHHMQGRKVSRLKRMRT